MTRIITATVGLEEELERLCKVKDQLDQECAWILESEREMGEDLKVRDQEHAGMIGILE
jgi:hypothetical protein